jgi:hypothetical protein
MIPVRSQVIDGGFSKRGIPKSPWLFHLGRTPENKLPSKAGPRAPRALRALRAWVSNAENVDRQFWGVNHQLRHFAATFGTAGRPGPRPILVAIEASLVEALLLGVCLRHGAPAFGAPRNVENMLKNGGLTIENDGVPQSIY